MEKCLWPSMGTEGVSQSRRGQGSSVLTRTSDVPSEVISWGSAGTALENLKDLFVFSARAANPPGYHSSATEPLSAPDQRVPWHCLLHNSFVFINHIKMSNLCSVCKLSVAQISLSAQDLPTVTYWQSECKQPVLYTSNAVLPYLYLAE